MQPEWNERGPAAPALERLPFVAVNHARSARGSIHEDAVARHHGFAGALVGGLSVFGAMLQLPLLRLGGAWLAGGYASARFIKPVYDGDALAAVMQVESARPFRARLWAEGPAGDRRTVGDARLGGVTAPRAFPYRAVPPDARPDAPWPLVPGAEPVGRPLPPVQVTASVEELRHYRRRTGMSDDPLPGFAHPAWLATRCLRAILEGFATPPPAIHAGVEVWSLLPVAAGHRLVVHGGIADVFERHGHRFLVSDCEVRNGQDVPVARVIHTIIHRPAAVGRSDA